MGAVQLSVGVCPVMAVPFMIVSWSEQLMFWFSAITWLHWSVIGSSPPSTNSTLEVWVPLLPLWVIEPLNVHTPLGVWVFVSTLLVVHPSLPVVREVDVMSVSVLSRIWKSVVTLVTGSFLTFLTSFQLNTVWNPSIHVISPWSLGVGKVVDEFMSASVLVLCGRLFSM